MIKKFEEYTTDKVNYEIERRFLLNKLPNLKFDEIKSISQFYGVDEVGNFRVRKEESPKKVSYFITRKKFISKGINEEDENSISKDEFEKRKSECTKMINKIRHVFYLEDGLKWEVDIFRDFEMIAAEIEIPNLEYDIHMPQEIKDVLIEEITDRKDLSNFALAIPLS